MTLIDTIGFIAAALTTLSFLPQPVHVIRTKETAGISLLMYVMFTVGVALWLYYGIAIKSWPVAVANGITLLLAGTVLAVTVTTRSK